MSRVALVASRARVREALVEVARERCVELVGMPPAAEGEAVEAVRRLARTGAVAPSPALAEQAPDIEALERDGRADLLAGEVELGRRAGLALDHGSFAAWVGWAPLDRMEPLNERLAAVGAVAVELPAPSWVEPPTLFRPASLARPFLPLVSTYGTARYRDIDPTAFTAVSFVLMFGMMFGDVGHGLVLAALALGLRLQRRGPLASLRGFWPIPFAAGLSGACFGLLYGECFGPTGLVPRLWLDPLDRPLPLLVVAVGVGAVLLSVGYVLGIVNRWRSGGLAAAVFDQSGMSGFSIFVGGGVFAGGAYWHQPAAEIAGGALAGVGVVLLGAGLIVAAGTGGTSLLQAGIELFDALVRLASNLVSFTRLAAFGLMHAALGAVVFEATRSLWGGIAGSVAAVLVFVAGNALAFALETLVTGVQALRLEYYELFSRVFSGEGHAFAPWTLPVLSTEEE
jgi:V/A-type H+-transporting ATPase subunit I